MAHETRPRTLAPDNLGALERWLADRIGADDVTIEKAELLSGGAIGENWKLAIKVEGGPKTGAHDWVLRTDAASRLAVSHDRADEFACLRAAHEAGVTVPEPIADCADAELIGAPFMVVGHVGGYAQGHKLVRDPLVGRNGAGLAEQLGRELAKIHSLRPPGNGLDFLQLPEKSPALVQVDRMRASLDTISEPRPALEYVLRWLERNAPATGDVVLCHGDFRTGNFMVQDGTLTGILDWEFCHWGDPHFDAGWFCARCWRFGADEREAGGIGPREAFYEGYNAQADRPLDETVIPYWEILAAARWATVALLQCERHVTGGEPSIELLLTGLMAPEMEYDALQGIIALEGRET
jgi:aminoglycoside phosphotransferase (APT) family kinase protein